MSGAGEELGKHGNRISEQSLETGLSKNCGQTVRCVFWEELQSICCTCHCSAEHMVLKHLSSHLFYEVVCYYSILIKGNQRRQHPIPYPNPTEEVKTYPDSFQCCCPRKIKKLRAILLGCFTSLPFFFSILLTPDFKSVSSDSCTFS